MWAGVAITALSLATYEVFARSGYDPRPYGGLVLLLFVAACVWSGYQAGFISAAIIVAYTAVANFTDLLAAPTRPDDGWRSVLFAALGYGGIALASAIIQRKLQAARSKAFFAQESAESEAELRRVIVDSAFDAIIAMAHDGRITLWNPRAEELFGWSANEVLGQLLVETIVPPHMRSAHQEGLVRYNQTGETRILGKRLELPALHREGHCLDVELSVAPFPKESGNFFVAFIRDISERKSAEKAIHDLHQSLEKRVEERTRQLAEANYDLSNEIENRRRAEAELRKSRQELGDYVDTMTTMNAKIGLDGSIIFANRIAHLASGLSQEELAKKNFLEGDWWTFDPKVQERVKTAFARAVSGEAIRYDENLFIFGRVSSISFSLVPVRGEDGEVQYIVAEATDISALKEAEEQLREQTIKLETANRELEAFSHSVSHDLRTPLRAIDGFSLALLEDYGDKFDESGKDYLKRVRAASQRMAQLIDDLLNLSRVSRSAMKKQRVSLSSIASGISNELKAAQPERKANVSISPGLTVVGDPRLMRVALQNLLDNAWKFTSKKETAFIEFGVEETDQGRAYFVRDNGAGFDMAYSGRLFGAFERLHSDAEFPGTGVGLATVARIVERHGGAIWAESALGKGATFYFTLPGASNSATKPV